MAEKNTDAQPSKGGGLNLKVIIVVGVLVVLLAFGVSFGTLMFLGKGGSGAVQATESQDVKANIECIYDMGEFTSNIQAKSGLRFVKVQVTLELSDAKLIEEIENKRPRIQDTIITILRSKSFEELQETNATYALKKQIKENINRYLVKGKVENVFFTYFVTQ